MIPRLYNQNALRMLDLAERVMWHECVKSFKKCAGSKFISTQEPVMI